MKKLYEEDYIRDIADHIRTGLNIDDTMSISEMPDYIDRLGNPYIMSSVSMSSSHLDEDGNWVRPTEYEDVGQLTWGNNEEVCYLSLAKSTSAPWALGLYITAAKGWKIEYGHVSGGEFVANGSPELVNSNTVYVKVLPDAENTLVARITSQNMLYPISYFAYNQFTTAQIGSAINVAYYFQPVVERVGNLPYVTNTANSSTTRGFSSACTERDALSFGSFTGVTSLANAWNYSYNLEELDVSSIDTSHWKVTNLNNTFANCSKLRKLDLSTWDTSLWAVTNLSSTFSGCVSLIDLRISGWNTTNWKVTTMASTFNYCVSIEDFGISNWDTSNWAVTTLSNTFASCFSLKTLDLSKWNTSRWAVTTIAYMVQNNSSLKSIDISTWDVSNWAVSTTTYMFSNCISLIAIDLADWDVSNWPLTTASYMFDGCRSLKHLLISNWNTSGWRVTTLSYMFQNCSNLEVLPIENWNTANWPLTTMAGFVSNCISLESLNLSNWNNANFNITDCRTATVGCRNLRYVNISTLKITASPSSSYVVFLANEANLNLVELYPQPNLNYTHSYSAMINLSRESLLRILNSLPNATGSRTLTLTNLRMKLTPADLAIATVKGWTVA